MQKIIFDELLGEYLDENGQVVNGTPVVEKHSFGGEYDAQQIIPAPDTSVEDAEKIMAVEKAIRNFKAQIKQLEESKKQVISKLLKQMQSNDVWSIKVGDASITRVKESEKHIIDSERLKAEMPEIAEMYSKTVYVSESLRIKTGGTENEDN